MGTPKPLEATHNGLHQVLVSAVARLLRPLVRVLLANGLPFGAFMDLAKRAYVEVALNEFGIPGKKQTISRVSVLTGLTRKEVQRLLQDASLDESVDEGYNRAARVVSGWVRDPEFTDSFGEPLLLPVEGVITSFSALVRRYSGDMPARAVLDELVRVGAIERLHDGRLRLLARAYVPRKSDVEKLGILGHDVADLISTIDHNLEHGATLPFFQRKVMYDNLPVEALEELRTLTAANGQQLLERLDKWLARQDRDVNPDVKGTGRMRAGIGIYYFEQDLQATRTPTSV